MTACRRCGASNPDGARFCVDCGSALSPSCPVCGQELPLPVRYCPACGTQIAPSAVAEEQRRVVSVLFADLVGFTSRMEEADPEEVRGYLREYYARSKESIERFGGRVEKFIGDAVMAVFGTPVARGDDAERAVRAALLIPDVVAALSRTTPGLELRVRVAVNTGETMVAVDTAPGPGEVLVAGDVVNTAARLQTAAPPGRVLVGEETYRATRRAIRYQLVEPVDAKGKREPVPAWLAVGPMSPFTDRTAGPSFVGRETELNLLRGVWDRATSDRRAHLITVLGEPGVGKSRLAERFGGHVEESGGRAFRVRELPYTQSSGYEAFGQLLKEIGGIFETDSTERAHEKFTASLRQLDFADPEAEQLLSLFVGPPQAVAVDRRALFDAARRYVVALASALPTFLVFEDIHYAHPSMLDLIESLAARTRDVPVVFLALARPELLDLRPGWGGGLPATTIRLEALSPGEAHSMAARLTADLPEEARARIETAAAGNPLFIEEMAAWVLEGGGRGPDLPTTVKAMVAARLDALPREERQVLYDASVVGKVFWRGALDRLGSGSSDLDRILDSLETRDIIRREPESKVEGDSEYAFRHILIRDVAYSTLPKGSRRARHESVARFIEDSSSDSDAVAAILAHHWREAGDIGRAVGYLLAAADRAEVRWASAEAVQLYEEALSLIPKDDEGKRRSIGLKRSVAWARHEHSVLEEAQLRKSPDPG